MLDVAIIGGGPAGLTAGMYATRGGLKKVTMFEMGMPGGQIMNSSEIENYPGVAESVSGMDLMEPWPEQCQKFGLKHDMAEVTNVALNSDKTFEITMGDGSKHQAISVILAMGSVPRRAGFKGEEEFFGRGVSTCATCDGFFYKNKEVVVVGGGDTALEEAVYLSAICSKVYLVHRRDTFRAAPSTIERARDTKNIELILNSSVDEVYGGPMGVEGLKIFSGSEVIDLKVPGIFTFVGNDVKNDAIKDDSESFLCEVNKSGEVVVNLNMRTSVDGLFAAGDLRIDAPKQVVCAAGDGATAALGAISYVDEFKNS